MDSTDYFIKITATFVVKKTVAICSDIAYIF